MTTEKWNATVLIRHPDESQGPALQIARHRRALLFVIAGLDPAISSQR
jgi:hypothetical protein